MTTVATADVLAHVLEDHPDVHASLVAAWEGAWASVDPCLLELCRLEIATLLGCDSELAVRTPAASAAGFDERKAEALGSWAAPGTFDARERAVLAYTDAFVVDVANLDDATSARVTQHLGEQGLADLTSALLVLEQRQRLVLAWDRLFGGTR